MTPQAIAAAAEALVEARRLGRLLDELPPAIRPNTAAEGYAVQDAFIRAWRDKLVGWKIGATAKVIMDKFGITEPFAGPFFSRDVMQNPARPLASANPHLCIEAEFAFRFGRALPPKSGSYTRAEVLDAVGSVIAAYEIIGPRFSRILFDAAPTVIADCGLNGAMALGAETRDWRKLDLKSHPVEFIVDGKLKTKGSGAAVMGDPLTVLEWTANHLSSRGLTLEAGQIVTTGASCGLLYLEAGETGVADFGALGKVEIQFVGPRSELKVRRG